jgi:anti-anti-sigma factor
VPEDRNSSQSTLAVLDEGAAVLENSNEESFASMVAICRPRLRLRLIDGFSVADILNADALFDWGVIRDLSAKLHGLLEQGHTRLLLNLSGIRFMSSDFLATLVALQRRMAAAQGRLGLFGLDPVIWDMVQICRLELVFDIYADESEAVSARLAACDEPRRE